MKKLMVIAVLVAVLTAAFATSAFAAGPVAPVPGQGAGYGRGNGGLGIHVPGTGLADGQNQAGRGGVRMGQGSNETVASIVGLTVDQLQAERLAGKSVVQIAADKGIAEDALLGKIVEARKATVTELLASGKITQAQADYMLSNMANHAKVMVERTNVGPAPFRGQSPMAGSGLGRINR